jgi:legumain
MAYNDAAWDDENPFKGTLYNKQDGQDVYAGCEMDYTGDDLTKQNYLAILKGDEAALNLSANSNSTRRVLKSTENS